MSSVNELLVRAVRRNRQQRPLVGELPVQIDRGIPRMQRVDRREHVRLEGCDVRVRHASLEQRARSALAVVDVRRIVDVLAARHEAAVERHVDPRIEGAVVVVVVEDRHLGAAEHPEGRAGEEARVVGNVRRERGRDRPVRRNPREARVRVSVRGHEHARLRLRIVVRDAARDVERESVGRVPTDREPARGIGLPAFRAELAAGRLNVRREAARRARRRRVVRARVVEAGYIAVHRPRHARNADVEVVVDRESARTLDVGAVELALGQRDVDVVLAVRLAGEQLQRAADRVASGERALRAAQNLDAVEVEEVDQVAGDRRVVDVVDIDADAGLDRRIEVRLADAADVRDERATERGVRGPQRDVRRICRDLK